MLSSFTRQLSLYNCRTEQDSEVAAGELVGLVKPGMSIGLIGNLGAGKTTLTRYLCSQLGAKDPVSSPTFVLQHEYHAASPLVIEHWDLYRLFELPPELFCAPAKNVIRIIEWPDKISDFDSPLDYVVRIEMAGIEGRIIRVFGRSDL